MNKPSVIAVTILILILIILLKLNSDLFTQNNQRIEKNNISQINENLPSENGPELPEDKPTSIPNKDVTDLQPMENLLAEASNGNPSAVYEVTVLRRQCENVPIDQESLEIQLNKINDVLLKKSLMTDFDACRDFPRKPIRDADLRDDIMYAARNGNLKAKLEFPAFAFKGFDIDNTLKNAELISELKDESLQHLIDARNGGEKSALIQLGIAYEDGNLVEQDLVEAFAHYYAHYELNLESNGLLLDNIEKKLSNAQLSDAINRGEMYVKCCN